MTALRLVRLLPNGLTLARLIAGLAFPWIPEAARLAVIVAALISDLVDGALSRLLGADSSLGRVLDPIADKVFVLGVAGTFLLEGRLGLGEMLLIATRDVLVFVMAGLILVVHGRGALGRMQARLPGKLTTALQFAFMVALFLDMDWLETGLLIATPIAGVVASLDYLLAYRRAKWEAPRPR